MDILFSCYAGDAHHAGWAHKDEMLHVVWVGQCVPRRQVATLQPKAAEVADCCCTSAHASAFTAT